MSYTRNDITIAVSTDGIMYIAQGTPAQEALEDMAIDDAEGGLFYSQINHRCAYHDGEQYRVGTPTKAKALGHSYEPYGRFTARAVGSPMIWSRV
jgi:hypothetical protein